MHRRTVLIIISALLLSATILSIAALPYLPFEDFFKCHIADDRCPNDNITFFLYTKETQETPTQLNMADDKSVTNAPFIKGRPIILLLHGYTGHKDFSPNSEIRPAYFSYGEFNIISVDYHPLAPEPCYLQAVHNLPVVAKCTAQLLDYIISTSEFTLNDIHVIGFSLGAQTAGMIANYIKSGKLKRITGLDPAKPMFIFASGDHKLGKDDAEFVDVMHTDVLQRGVLSPSGHVDFYVNGGIEQPGCGFQRNTSSCNHARAPQYYAESITSGAGFWGFRCKDWAVWALGMCTPASSDEMAIMGMKATNESQGLFFLNTNKDPPYAKGILPEFTLSDNETTAETPPEE